MPPGSPVAVLLLEEDPGITIFLPENRLAHVGLGQPAEVRVDGLEERIAGQVTSISRQAEFTPRNVQTRDERVSLVFAVKVTLKAPPPELKDGMWANVLLKGPLK